MTFSVLASQFSPSGAIVPSCPGYRKLATLNDMIHCVVYVVDSNNSSLLSPKMLDKFDAIRRKANRMGERCTVAYTGFFCSGVSPGAGLILFPLVYLQVFLRFCS